MKESENSNSDLMISCRNVSVNIPVYSSSNRSFKKTLLKRVVGGVLDDSSGKLSVKALSDISFNAYHGDSIGVLGHNGSGKTTLLKVLSGIFKPTSGEIEILGVPTPYFGINEGIAPEMTGYEAIEIGMIVRGLKRKDIPAVRIEVEEFAGLGDFLNLPIRTYSSGMQQRLMFAIATCVEPDILVIDENIVAGDARFQEQVKERVGSYINKARTLILASHNPGMLQEWCNRGILLKEGRCIYVGSIDEAIRLYNNGNYS